MSVDEQSLDAASQRLARVLSVSSRNVVFAESCTGGLIAATLSRIPGISRYLCGSAVVYQNATKTSWLGVSAVDLANPEIGPVSRMTAEAMAIGALNSTPHADWSAAVTGHLGPDAPETLDGTVYIGIVCRDSSGVPRPVTVELFQLPKSTHDPVRLRCERQVQVAVQVLQRLADCIESTTFTAQ